MHFVYHILIRIENIYNIKPLIQCHPQSAKPIRAQTATMYLAHSQAAHAALSVLYPILDFYPARAHHSVAPQSISVWRRAYAAYHGLAAANVCECDSRAIISEAEETKI